MKTTLLAELEPIRKNDYYGSPELKQELHKALFPSSMEELTLDLSSVTGAFYGLMLKNIGNKIGFDKIDEISKSVFYDLGKTKTKQCSEKMEILPIDTRAFFIVLTSAIFNASPEYTIKVINYTPEKTIFELNGVDRYLRILNQLEISEHITFPTLIPFMNGIKDELNISSELVYKCEIKEGTNEVKCTYEFTLI